MKILLFGKNGQVGRALQPVLRSVGNLVAYGRDQADFLHPEVLDAIISRESPDIIINAAAYTAVDKAEEEKDTALCVNATAVEHIARSAHDCGAWLIHFSTDYVYDGRKDIAYTESDIPSPLSVYGRSKLAGDMAIEKNSTRYIILRTSWVFGPDGRNFASTILQLAAVRENLYIVGDQIGAPCSSALLAELTRTIIQKIFAGDRNSESYAGIYHTAPHGKASWADYATFLIEEARKAGLPVKARSVSAITSAEYGAAAPRPANSLMDCSKLEHRFGIILPDWTADVIDYVQDYAARKINIEEDSKI